MKRTVDRSIGVAYLRVSSSRQELSPDAQKRLIAAWADSNRLQVVSWHCDVIRGPTPLDKRPGLLEAMTSLDRHRAGFFLIAHRDRLARDVLVAQGVEALVAKLGADMINADGRANGNDPAAVLFRTMLDAFAQFERSVQSIRLREALAEKRHRGEALGCAPWGWHATPGGRLEEDLDERRVTGWIVAMVERGASMTLIRRTLERIGVVGRRGQPLGRVQIGAIIKKQFGRPLHVLNPEQQRRGVLHRARPTSASRAITG